ncbi:Shikimate kinase [Candidatus Tremblaya princeps]|uniref:Shikimate kinase n=1 Tax=Tremblaya princeps TaxID=189385 RepID=A0A143WNJ7_TREPR|nr:Shikimate kinase [Candidatus Tremblaya princeps]
MRAVSMPAGGWRVRTAVAMVGPMGTGKTTLGRIVSLALRVQCTDTDCSLEACLHVSIWQVFACLGEGQFRKWELQMGALSYAPITSHGGGSVALSQSRCRLRRTRCVHIEGSPREVARRLGAPCAERPLYRAFDLAMRRRRDILYRTSTMASAQLGGLQPSQAAWNLLSAVG